MLKINLLPKENRPLSYSMPRVLFLIALFPIIILACIFSNNYFTIKHLETESLQAQQQYLMYSKAVEQKANIDKRLDLLKSKESALENIAKSQNLWRKILIELSVITPPDVWLVNFSMADNMIVNLKGNAGSYSGIANLMKLLDEDAMFENPVLITSGFSDSGSVPNPSNNNPSTTPGNPATTVTNKNNVPTTPTPISSSGVSKSIANFEIIVQVRGQ